MSKVTEPEEDDPLDKELTDFEGAVRGKYAYHGDVECIMAVIDPDLSKVFTSQEAVNKALRFLMETGYCPAANVAKAAK